LSKANNPFLDAFRTVIKITTIIMIVVFILLLILEVWTIKDVLINLAKFLGMIGATTVFVIWIYFAFLESYLAERNRDKTAEVCVENYGLTNQVSGKPRSGKDSSTIGEARLMNEIELERDLEEMEKLRSILHIYDFDKLHDYLDHHGQRFLVSGKNRLIRKYALVMKENDCFLRAFYITRKIIDPSAHIREFLIKKDQYVFDYRMEDGLRPGGIPFQELLLKYIVLFTYRIFITNYIMSNQPILEQFDIEDNGKINFNFSKRFSQQYIRIKEDNPIPLPLRGVIIETEMAILLSNVDKDGEAAAKILNGIREFYTVIGHIIGERIYMFAIVQDPNRQIKTVRELYQVYIHVFKQETVATGSMRRTLLDLYKFQQKANIWTFQLMHRLSRKRSRVRKVYQKLIERSRKRVSQAVTIQERIYNSGYLVTYKGVYSNERDVGKKVRFPRFGVKLDAVNDQIIYPAFGFKSYIRISDTWGRYNTHFVKFLRDSKENRHKMHYNDVPNWTSFELTDDDARGMDYSALNEILEGVMEKPKEKQEKKTKTKRLIPAFANLNDRELLLTCLDYGYKMKSWHELVGEQIVDARKLRVKGKLLNRLPHEAVDRLAKKLQDDFPDMNVLTHLQWKAQIVSFLENEWKKAFAAKKEKE
jgi:hypothetical protein